MSFDLAKLMLNTRIPQEVLITFFLAGKQKEKSDCVTVYLSLMPQTHQD